MQIFQKVRIHYSPRRRFCFEKEAPEDFEEKFTNLCPLGQSFFSDGTFQSISQIHQFPTPIRSFRYSVDRAIQRFLTEGQQETNFYEYREDDILLANSVIYAQGNGIPVVYNFYGPCPHQGAKVFS